MSVDEDKQTMVKKLLWVHLTIINDTQLKQVLISN